MASISGTETILMVDDDLLIVCFTSELLKNHGYTVIAASGGAEAVSLVKNRPDVDIHLLLVDIAMPDLSGPDVVRRIREILPNVPALYMSGYLSTESPAGVASANYIAKPFTSLQLRTKIREVLDRANAAG